MNFVICSFIVASIVTEKSEIVVFMNKLHAYDFVFTKKKSNILKSQLRVSLALNSIIKGYVSLNSNYKYINK